MSEIVTKSEAEEWHRYGFDKSAASQRRLLESHAAAWEHLRAAVAEFEEFDFLKPVGLAYTVACSYGHCGATRGDDVHSCPRILAHRARLAALAEYDGEGK